MHYLKQKHEKKRRQEPMEPCVFWHFMSKCVKMHPLSQKKFCIDTPPLEDLSIENYQINKSVLIICCKTYLANVYLLK